MDRRYLSDVVGAVQAACTADLLKPAYRARVQQGAHPLTGHCYAASEAVYHLLGGKAAGLTPMVIRHEGETHWYLRWRTQNLGATFDSYIDPTSEQFQSPPLWSQGRPCGFLTREPSKRAQTIIERARAILDAAARVRAS